MAEQLHRPDKEFSLFQETAAVFATTRDPAGLDHGFPGDLKPISKTVPLTLGRKSAAGSAIGCIAETKVLLDFYGRHGITSDIEVIKTQDINEA